MSPREYLAAPIYFYHFSEKRTANSTLPELTLWPSECVGFMSHSIHNRSFRGRAALWRVGPWETFCNSYFFSCLSSPSSLPFSPSLYFHSPLAHPFSFPKIHLGDLGSTVPEVCGVQSQLKLNLVHCSAKICHLTTAILVTLCWHYRPNLLREKYDN